MTDVHWPGLLKRNIRKHRPAGEFLALRRPERWMLRSGLREPSPRRGTPQGTLRISAGPNKLQIFGICDFVLVDAEFRDLQLMTVEFVVPAKRAAVSREAERGQAGRNLRLAWQNRGRIDIQRSLLRVLHR